ncbi:inorganic phosphate transporter [uncultured Helicobacter sp.]|uniref:inorganic phosphate transporter n=1 Tax=uncultured Helicobacter sp. TaxID=175537 RepID=UPI00374E5661
MFGNVEHHPFLIIFTCVVGAYMAMNIGANDVANNMGPAVGSKSISLMGAIVIAVICEAAGAILAGGDVVDTVKSGIIDPKLISSSSVFVLVMLAALISGALWLHLATLIRAPVSTTHSIVGGILGAGIAAGGLGVAKWDVLFTIMASWVISPLLGGVIAGAFLWFIKLSITYKSDKRRAARVMIPILVAIMSFSFSLYLISKGLKNVISLSSTQGYMISLAIAVVVYFVMRPVIASMTQKMSNDKDSVNALFAIPLVVAAAFLSFAHGANDVANAIGPLAAINQMLGDLNSYSTKAPTPLWIMLIGGFGISVGLALYGPRLIKAVGSEITELNKIRAFCVAMSAAITVLVASQLGLPVSSTHVTIGAIFGVGFLREYLKKRYYEMQQTIIQAHRGKDSIEVEKFLDQFNKASVKRKGEILESLKRNEVKNTLNFSKKEKRSLKKAYKNELVKRSAINRIIASWIVTVPISALLGAFSYFMIMWIGIEL